MGQRRRCAVTGCRHAPSTHTPGGCRTCSCPGWLDRKPHVWKGEVTEAWLMATQAWLLAAEEASNGWRTELEEFAVLHPRPRLQDFMAALSPGAAPEQARLGPAVCPHCKGTGRPRPKTSVSD